MAMGRVKDGLKPLWPTKISATPAQGAMTELQSDNPAETAALKYAFDLNARAIPSFTISEVSSRSTIVSITRKHDQIVDEVIIQDDWMGRFSGDDRNTLLPRIYTQLVTLIQKELRCDDVVAAFTGGGDSEWNRYRTAQMEVLNSLQQTNQHLLIDTAKKIEETRSDEFRRNEELRAQLRKEFEGEQARLSAEHASRVKLLDAREEELKAKLAIYETHEALYVARKKSEEQLEQLKAWLKDSSLTKETVQKRRPVMLAYWAAIVGMAYLTYSFADQSYQLLKASGANLHQLPWWQWTFLTVKSVSPLAAFTTFAIYYIRWEGAWARQHADEELRTRARIIDIGRSSWLLEAVRDGKSGVPVELLKELSRNLFSLAGAGDAADIHPRAVTDLIMQDLTSLKVSGNGTTIEAAREKK